MDFELEAEGEAKPKPLPKRGPELVIDLDYSKKPHPYRALRPALRIGTALCLLVLGISYFYKGVLPDASLIKPEISEQPLQEEVEAEPFKFEYSGTNYLIVPITKYEISGLVVSHNNTIGWGDIYHDETSVDFKDLCLLYGQNVTSNGFQQMQYWSEPWSCHFKTNSQKVAERFNFNDISNNHLLSDNPEVIKLLRSVRIGDQIQMKGFLIDYYLFGMEEPIRTTSLTRNDTGDGACEVMWVKEAKVLARGNEGWYAMWTWGWRLLGLLVVVQIALLIFMPLEFW